MKTSSLNNFLKIQEKITKEVVNTDCILVSLKMFKEYKRIYKELFEKYFFGKSETMRSAIRFVSDCRIQFINGVANRPLDDISITFKIPKSLLHRLDLLAKKAGVNRSIFIRFCIDELYSNIIKQENGMLPLEQLKHHSLMEYV